MFFPCNLLPALGNPQCDFSHIPFKCLNKLGNLRLYYHAEPFSFGPLEGLYFFHSVTPLSTTNHLPPLLAKETKASGLPPWPTLKAKYFLPSLSCWITVPLQPKSLQLLPHLISLLRLSTIFTIPLPRGLQTGAESVGPWCEDLGLPGGSAHPPNSQLGWWQANARVQWN